MFVPTKPRVNWRTAIVFCGLVLGIGAGTPLAPSAGAQAAKTVVTKPAARPKLVVMLVVDQMRADYVDKFQGQWTGGLKRLVEEGAWFREAAYPYAATETCVGHSTISTGAFPATHGMISNEWWDREQQKGVTCTSDPRVKNIGYGGASVKGGDQRGEDADARVCGGIEVSERRRHAGGDIFVEGTRGYHYGRPSGGCRDVV